MGDWPTRPSHEVLARRRDGQARACKRSTRALDEAPSDPHELADWFCSLPLDDLAGCWPGVLIDHLALEDPSNAAYARALAVVAERLHQVALLIAAKEIELWPRQR